MKVLLVNPPRENDLTGNNPALIDEARGFNPPLGLLYLAGYLEEKTSHQVEICDAQVEELSYPALKARIRKSSPDLVGLTAMTFTLLDVVKSARLVKEIDPSLSVVVGGVHAFLYPEETVNLPEIDYVLSGEGEESFALLLDRLENRGDLDTVPGLIYLKDGRVQSSPSPPLCADLDALPFPARRLTPYGKYSSVMARRQPITTMFTSRGCPFRCSFCARPHLGKQFRYRSAENVVDEMEECVGLGIREFLIYDDTFTVNRDRAIAVAEEIILRELKIGWDIRARVDCVDREMLKILKVAGCERIHYGVEAGTEKILKVLNKGITLDKARETIALTRKIGIETLAYFMIGSPTETRADILETIRFALELKPDFVHATILCPFPGTAIYEQGLSEGVFPRDHWREFAANPAPGFSPPYWNEILSDVELQELLQLAYKKFYTRPSYLLKKTLQVRSIRELKTKFKAGMKIFRMKER
ncbi:MAG: radical SAM protein [Candidatus Erginobacter occultus]|nr:radical SAM protein [Candidatus Erginobacter occultus]